MIDTSTFGKLSSAIPGLHFTNHLLSLLFWWPAHNSPSFVIGCMLHLSPLFTFSVYWSDAHFSCYEYLWNRTWLRANMWTSHISWLTERIPWFRFVILLSFVNSLFRSGSHPTERVSSIQVQICGYFKVWVSREGKEKWREMCKLWGICQQWGRVSIYMERMERHLNRQFDTFSPSEYTSSTQIRSE